MTKFKNKNILINNKSNSQRWLRIWNKKGHQLKTSKTLDIIKANGWDSKFGQFNEITWFKYIKSLVNSIKIRKNSKILEYGCGAGAFLSYWYKKEYKLFGIDYSKPLINKCKKHYPKMNVYHGKISTIKKLKNKFDLIFSHSVFQYFDNSKYAKSLINEMITYLNPNGYILILDVPDKDKEKKFLRRIKKAIGLKKYNELYGIYKHNFYKKSFFKKLAIKNRLRVKIFSHSLAFNENSKFRYNVIYQKKSY